MLFFALQMMNSFMYASVNKVFLHLKKNTDSSFFEVPLDVQTSLALLNSFSKCLFQILVVHTFVNVACLL